MGTSTTIPSLQLELPKFESLTAGTNLPQVSAEDIEAAALSTPSPPSSAQPRATADEKPPIPTTEPPRPTSMRKFLSRVSLSSSPGHTDDKTSVFSAPTPTPTMPDVRKPKKSSWWKKSSSSKHASSKRHSIMPGAFVSANHEPERKPYHDNEKKYIAIPAPPRLPDDMFGKNLGSLDGDMFKNFK